MADEPTTVCGECLQPDGQHTRDCSKAAGSMAGN